MKITSERPMRAPAYCKNKQLGGKKEPRSPSKCIAGDTKVKVFRCYELWRNSRRKDPPSFAFFNITY